MWLFLAFVAVPIILGTVMMRSQGMAVMAELQQKMQQGGNPGSTLAAGAMVLFAGALLLTPGFFTDAVGFSLLLPPVRSALISYIGPKLAARMTVMQPGQPPDPTQEDVVDAEYETLNEDDLPPDNAPRGQSGWTRPQ